MTYCDLNRLLLLLFLQCAFIAPAFAQAEIAIGGVGSVAPDIARGRDETICHVGIGEAF
jgi:hypothetical protein